MMLPPMHGKCDQDKFFIYAAADRRYFDLHGKALINSVCANTPEYGVHMHIYDPTLDQIKFCKDTPGVSVTYENLDAVPFNEITDYWLTRTEFDNDRQRQMAKKGRNLGEKELTKLIRQTYYACVRFIRLAAILDKDQQCLAIDVDGLVRGSFDIALGDCDFYLYEKPKDGTHLAGAILFNGQPNTKKFLKEYAYKLQKDIELSELYWFLDQLILDQLVPKYNKGLLPMTYIDWAMREHSAIWSAKGKRKELEVFKLEQQKYLESAQ